MAVTFKLMQKPSGTGSFCAVRRAIERSCAPAETWIYYLVEVEKSAKFLACVAGRDGATLRCRRWMSKPLSALSTQSGKGSRHDLAEIVRNG
jgi:hypothetical protein